MVEVQNIGKGERPPEGADWVLIEKAPSGRFVANGSVAGTGDAVFFRPPPFDTVEAAIAVSRSWAEANDVPTIYVRNIP
jgi:hypothetical protein